ALKWKPRYFDAIYNLAFSHEQLRHYKKAVYFYGWAVKVDPTYVNAWSNMANIYNDYLDKMDSAIIINQKIMKIIPNSDLPYVNIATYYLIKADSVNAMKYLELASEKTPSNNVVAGILFNYYQGKDNVKAEKYRNIAGIPSITFK
ncbi:MAG: hypothetical protein HY951_15705, partial [Bacteroidia bacterium]|nr:hypothetical protein [Bacteroidia bacterium]